MHPISLWHALKDAGMTCRVNKGKLLVSPIASLQGELRDQVIEHRAALVAWLECEKEDNARIDALVKEASLFCPFDHPEPEGRGSVLVRVNLPGEPAEFVAVDPGYWNDLVQWSAEMKEIRKKDAEKKAKKTGKKK